MSFIYDFADNAQISADDLNSIAEGISENAVVSDNFADNTSYAINKLNLIRSDILNPGVASGMQCSYSDGNIIISPGIAFFANGMRLQIIEDEILMPVKNGISYVYLYASESFNCALPVISDTEKTSNAYIPIATVDTYGIVTDMRSFCSSKIPLSGGANIERYVIEKKVTLTASNASPNATTEQFNIANKAFSYITFNVIIDGKNTSNIPYFEYISGFFKRSNMLCYGFYKCYSSGGNQLCYGLPYIGEYSASKGTYVMPSYENDILTLKYDSSHLQGTMTVTMEVI